jgi:hypothetical protein
MNTLTTGVTEQDAILDNALDFCSAGSRFGTRPGHRLTLMLLYLSSDHPGKFRAKTSGKPRSPALKFFVVYYLAAMVLFDKAWFIY